LIPPLPILPCSDDLGVILVQRFVMDPRVVMLDLIPGFNALTFKGYVFDIFQGDQHLNTDYILEQL